MVEKLTLIAPEILLFIGAIIVAITGLSGSRTLRGAVPVVTAIFLAGAAALGLEPLLAPEDMGPIISSYLFPKSQPNFDFKVLYSRLSDKGFVIYPGTTYSHHDRPTLRVGHIGDITPEQTQNLLDAFHEVYEEMGVSV